MDLLQKMQDATVKFENIIYFTGREEEGNDLGELLCDHDDNKLKELFGFDTYEMGEEELLDSLEEAGYLGNFFANVHTPKRSYHSKTSTGFAFSWGYTTYTLIFAKTFEELVDKAVVWAKDQHKRMQNEAPTSDKG